MILPFWSRELHFGDRAFASRRSWPLLPTPARPGSGSPLTLAVATTANTPFEAALALALSTAKQWSSGSTRRPAQAQLDVSHNRSNSAISPTSSVLARGLLAGTATAHVRAAFGSDLWLCRPGQKQRAEIDGFGRQAGNRLDSRSWRPCRRPSLLRGESTGQNGQLPRDESSDVATHQRAPS
jgi:hypothetical protein